MKKISTGDAVFATIDAIRASHDDKSCAYAYATGYMGSFFASVIDGLSKAKQKQILKELEEIKVKFEKGNV